MRLHRTMLLTGLVLMPTFGAPLQQSGMAETAGPRVELPRDFRTSLNHYATVDRAAGKIYELYVNDAALEGWQRVRRFPDGAVFGIDTAAALELPGGASGDDPSQRTKIEEDHLDHHVRSG